ncbi:MAG: DNA repair protein RecN [Bacteroidales bacterium]|jgi:DNA repair protein RecN (Recombination protein N)|nr:DNA repair protein RecN [Bacteroidales bacterium]
MLKKLSVHNYALIKELEIEPCDGLTIITGETGAGKSILLGALSLILGARADSSAVLDAGDKCIVEGSFRVEDYDLEEFFRANDLDFEPLTMLRREINQSGKSRAFINDTPVTLNVLKDLGDRLIDIHSQHQTLMLHDNLFQLNVIDSFADTAALLGEYRKHFQAFRAFQKEYSVLREASDKNRADLEYYMFQLDQLEKAGLREGEQEELETEQELLSHTEEIKVALDCTAALLSTDEGSVVARLNEAMTALGRIRDYHPEAAGLMQRIDTAYIELRDIAGETERLSFSVEADPGRLVAVNERLDTIYSLIRKHRVENLGDLLEKKKEIAALIDSISTGDNRLNELEKLVREEEKALAALSDEISGKRKAVVAGVEGRIAEMLTELGMPKARFRIRLEARDGFTFNGRDTADFLFSANRQTDPESLARIASGGELSRVMLTLKSLLTRNKNMPTIIFDEIDSGVSGEVADKVGRILSGMGDYMQVINITHLPQVASRGTRHFHVFKEDSGDATITRVKLLTPEERVYELARLLSGSTVSDTALENARELLESAGN